MIYLEKDRQEKYPKCVVYHSMWTSDRMIWPNNTVGQIKGIASVADRVTQIRDPPSNPVIVLIPKQEIVQKSH